MKHSNFEQNSDDDDDVDGGLYLIISFTCQIHSTHPPQCDHSFSGKKAEQASEEGRTHCVLERHQGGHHRHQYHHRCSCRYYHHQHRCYQCHPHSSGCRM